MWQALHYDIRRGPHSIGSHVRDAAAYVCWAFGRAYCHVDMKNILQQLAPHLLTVACYDREVPKTQGSFLTQSRCFFLQYNDATLLPLPRLIVEEQLLLLFKRMLDDKEIILMVSI